MDASTLQPAEAGGFSFRLFRFPVRVRWGFFFTTFVLAWIGGLQTARELATWIGVGFVSVLWHELGHALAAAAFGASSEIELCATGGLTHRAALVGSRWWKETVVSLAGPAAGLALGGVVWVIVRVASPPSAAVAQTLGFAIWINVGWSLLNLLPILPYDGGSALRAGLLAASPKRGEVASHVVSIVVGAVACGIAIAMNMFWAAYLAGAAAARSFGDLGQLRREARVDAAWAALRAGRPADAIAQVETLRRERLEGFAQACLAELAAWIALHAGDAAAARQRLAEMPAGYRPSLFTRAMVDALDGEDPAVALRETEPSLIAVSLPPLAASWIGNDAEQRVGRLVTDRSAAVVERRVLVEIATALFHGREWRAALVVSMRAFAAHHDPGDAYNAACCLSRLDQPADGLTWLERAVDAGYRDLAFLRADEDLAAVRDLPAFEALAARLSTTGGGVAGDRDAGAPTGYGGGA